MRFQIRLAKRLQAAGAETIVITSIGGLRRAALSYNEAILTTTATFDVRQKTREDRLKWFESHDGWLLSR